MFRKEWQLWRYTMSETRVSMTDLRQNLASLINRATYGGERIVLVSHGEPKAVIISVDELRRLEQQGDEQMRRRQFTQTMAAADRLREEARRWQEEHGIEVEDSVETLRRLREERDDELTGLR
jgi:prevent-host-death family protein